jgi:hypothetical protein
MRHVGLGATLQALPRFRSPRYASVATTCPAAAADFSGLYPYAVSRWCLRRVNERDAMPGIFYMHPWELDQAQPRPRGLGMKTRFRHYLNLHRLPARLEALLRDFRWSRMDQIFAV